MKKLYLLALIFVIVSLQVTAQQAKLDSLLKLNADYSKEDDKKLRILRELAFIQANMNPHDGLITSEKSIVIAQKLNNQKELVHGYTNKSCNYIALGQMHNSDSILKKAFEISSLINDEEGLAECYLRMSSSVPNDTKGALEKLSTSLSLYQKLNNTKRVAEVYLYIGSWYRNISYDTARIYFEKSRASYQEINDEVGIANALGFMGGTYFWSAEYDKALDYFTKSLPINKRIGNLGGLQTDNHQLGMLYSFKGNNPRALDYYFTALRIAETRGDIAAQAGLLVNIGLLYLSLKDYTNAMSYFKKGIVSGVLSTNNMYSANGYLGIGQIYLEQNKNDSALFYFEKGKELCLKIGDELLIANAYNSLGGLYEKRKEYSIAFEYIQKSATMNKKIGNNVNYMENLLFITRIIKNATPNDLIKMNIQPALQYTEAMKYAFQALALIQVSGELDFLREVNKEVSELYDKQHNTSKAYYYYKQYIIFKDSILNKENAQSVASLQIQYETEKKEQQITLLNKDNELQTKELDKQKLMRNGFIAGFGVMILFAGLFLFQRNNITKEKKRSDNLLLNILPAEVADELKSTGTASAKHFDNVTVLFTDFKSFTTVSEQLTPQELVNELHACFKGFDEICSKYSIEKIKTIGDAYLAVCGLPLADEKHAENVVRAALEIREFMEKRRENLGAKTFEIRIGINSGSVVAGIVGVKKFAYDIWGDTVNTAARMEQNSEAGKINISETTYALVKDKFTCEYRGEIDAKNKGKLAMYFVENYRSVL